MLMESRHMNHYHYVPDFKLMNEWDIQFIQWAIIAAFLCACLAMVAWSVNKLRK